MNIGPNYEIKPFLMWFYDHYYDVLPTPDYNNETRFLNGAHGKRFLGNSHKKICRFCGKSSPEFSFSNVAHALPESIGNKVLATCYECDSCNSFFGNTIEREYAKFFHLYHSVMGISGKEGKVKFNYKIHCSKKSPSCMEYCVKLNFGNVPPTVKICKEVDNDIISLKKNSLMISAPVGKCCPIAVFKSLVKMAITVMPEEEVFCFSNTINWILKKEHDNYYRDKLLKIKYLMFPGFNVVKSPCFVLYRRKESVSDVPYMLFNLTYGFFSFLIEVPCNGDVSETDNASIDRLPFPPVPYYASQYGVYDMTYKDVPKGQSHFINFDFGFLLHLFDTNEN